MSLCMLMSARRGRLIGSIGGGEMEGELWLSSAKAVKDCK